MKRKDILVAFILSSCGEPIPAACLGTSVGGWTSSLGVRVWSASAVYLTPEMARVMEVHLIDVFAATSAVTARDVRTCVSGLQVFVRPEPSGMCLTRHKGIQEYTECLGATHVNRNIVGECVPYIDVFSTGDCAYYESARGPAYEHELVHAVQLCAQQLVDYDHTNPIWTKLAVNRACPKAAP